MRPVDVGRAVGVSAQQIRLYLEDGLLPPAPRTASGHRHLGPAHLAAAAAYRALIPGFGWGGAKPVMRAVVAGDVPAALALVDEAHARLHQERATLREVEVALAELVGPGADPEADARPPGRAGAGAGAGLLVGQVARRLGVRASTLRVWEAAGLLSPSRERRTRYRRYSPLDVRDARIVLALRRGGQRLEAIAPVLDGVHGAGSPEALARALRERTDDLDRRSRALLAAGAALDAYLREWVASPPAGRS